jgi:glycosyltransferase involved in cell wall biosynthesis
MKYPVVSVIIPCFNHGMYIDEAIASVESCKEINFEVIVINDGSTDNFTINKLHELSRRSIIVIHQNNKGVSVARNHGISISKGKYILPLDADNKIVPSFLSRSVNILENNPDISIIYSDKFILKGNSLKHRKVGKLDVRRMLRANYIDTCSVYRKTIWEVLGGYDEKINSLEDYEFWLSAIGHGFNFHYIKEPLFYYRVLENSKIRTTIKTPAFKEIQLFIYRKHISLLYSEYKTMFDKYYYFRRRPIIAIITFLYNKFLKCIFRNRNRKNIEICNSNCSV